MMIIWRRKSRAWKRVSKTMGRRIDSDYRGKKKKMIRKNKQEEEEG